MHGRDKAMWMVLVAGVAVAGACAQKHADHGDTQGAPVDAVAGSDGGAAAQPLPIDERAHVGAMAAVTLTPVEGAGREPGNEVDGSGTFAETATGVDLMLKMRSCVGPNRYPLTILEGRDCSAASLRGSSWDGARGADFAEVSCTAMVSSIGRATYTRPKSDKLAWSVGKPDGTNVLGHALIVSDPVSHAPLACGVIGRAPDAVKAPAPSAGASSPEERVTAVLAGICLSKTFVRDAVRECPNPAELNKCAREHCELAPCTQHCGDYLECLGESDDVCAAEAECELSQVCSDCRLAVATCVFSFCTQEIACAPPVAPDGPCSKLEACCAMQGDRASSCLETVHVLERLSGDASCVGAMHDWDTWAHLKVPCKFE